MKTLLITAFLLVAAPVAAFSQEKVVCPAPYICLTPQAAQVAFDNAKEVPLLKEKIGVLEQGLKDKDVTIAETKATAAKNEADLKAALVKTQTDLATATGQLIGKEAELTRMTAIIDFMLKNGRKKCGVLTAICIQ